MPMIELTMPADSLAPETSARLLDDLCACLLGWENAPDTEFFRDITWSYLHETPPGALRANGRPGQRFRVDVTVPTGALSQRRKDGLVAAVHELVTAAAGLGPAEGLHVWTLIHEVPDGSWGAAGHTVRYAQLAQVAAAERSGSPA